MASNEESNNTQQESKFTLSMNPDMEQQQISLDHQQVEEKEFDYSKRSQWLRAAVLGANDGLVSTASLMMGIGAVKKDIKVMILTGFAGLVAGASFSVGAIVPLLAASFIRDYKVRIGAVVAAVTIALMVFGWLGAVLGKAPAIKSSARVLFGGWLAMAITYGLTKLIGSSGL
uniref:Vacuolar iron transporter n=1 Tax=Solanum lycopersicum TaxID=4081 RepID=A0A3Q7G7E6_SOLLC